MKWRVLPFQLYHGKRNMVIDEIIFQNQQHQKSPPTIRFYGWKNPCLSLGYFQKAEKELFFEKISQDKIEVVTRITGGRAVFHIDEITYSVIAPVGAYTWCSTQRLSYEFISKALLESLKVLNIDFDLNRSDPVERSAIRTKNPCFSSSARNEIIFQGKKMIGSAQKRNAFAFLQHGSILCSAKSRKVIDYLNFPESQKQKASEELQKKSISLEEILKCPIDILEIYNSMWKDFLKHMNILDPELGSLTILEEEQVRERLSSKNE